MSSMENKESWMSSYYNANSIYNSMLIKSTIIPTRSYISSYIYKERQLNGFAHI